MYCSFICLMNVEVNICYNHAIPETIGCSNFDPSLLAVKLRSYSKKVNPFCLHEIGCLFFEEFPLWSSFRILFSFPTKIQPKRRRKNIRWKWNEAEKNTVIIIAKDLFFLDG